MQNTRTHYQVLGFPQSASEEEIKRAYKNLALIYHPDKGGSKEKFQEIDAEYRVLSDQQKRKEYDIKLRVKAQEEQKRKTYSQQYSGTKSHILYS